jgi:hypothetical protein
MAPGHLEMNEPLMSWPGQGRVWLAQRLPAHGDAT